MNNTASLLLIAITALLISNISNSKTLPYIEVNAGYIQDDNDAKAKCTSICSGLKWNRQWISIPDRNHKHSGYSVCGTNAGVDVPVNDIRDQGWANRLCPKEISKVKWNGEWQPGQTAICHCKHNAKLYR